MTHSPIWCEVRVRFSSSLAEHNERTLCLLDSIATILLLLRTSLIQTAFPNKAIDQPNSSVVVELRILSWSLKEECEIFYQLRIIFSHLIISWHPSDSLWAGTACCCPSLPADIAYLSWLCVSSATPLFDRPLLFESIHGIYWNKPFLIFLSLCNSNPLTSLHAILYILSYDDATATTLHEESVHRTIDVCHVPRAPSMFSFTYIVYDCARVVVEGVESWVLLFSLPCRSGPGEQWRTIADEDWGEVKSRGTRQKIWIGLMIERSNSFAILVFYLWKHYRFGILVASSFIISWEIRHAVAYFYAKKLLPIRHGNCCVNICSGVRTNRKL